MGWEGGWDTLVLGTHRTLGALLLFYPYGMIFLLGTVHQIVQLRFLQFGARHVARQVLKEGEMSLRGANILSGRGEMCRNVLSQW